MEEEGGEGDTVFVYLNSLRSILLKEKENDISAIEIMSPVKNTSFTYFSHFPLLITIVHYIGILKKQKCLFFIFGKTDFVCESKGIDLQGWKEIWNQRV